MTTKVRRLKTKRLSLLSILINFMKITVLTNVKVNELWQQKRYLNALMDDDGGDGINVDNMQMWLVRVDDVQNGDDCDYLLCECDDDYYYLIYCQLNVDAMLLDY